MATRKRRKTNDDKAVLVGLGVVAAIGAFAWTVHELELHWWMGILFAAAAIAVVVVCVRIETAKQAATAARAPALRVDILAIDAASPKALEHTVAALPERDGFSAEVIGRAGDEGVDVLARDGAGHVLAVRCKHTRVGKRYGTPALYPVSGNSRGVYRVNRAALVTNGGITGPARVWGADPAQPITPMC